MEKRETARKFSRTVPVIIENHENTAKKTKLMVPSNYTAGHLVNILRSRMHLLPYNPVYLFLKSKQSPILMSKSIGHLHHKHRDEKGLLRLILAGQASFGFRGNIRAIRFRQKWIENLHNILHQDASGPPSYSGAPPPYFPLDPPSATHPGAPFDMDDINDTFEPLLAFNADIFDYLGNAFSMEVEDSIHTSDVSNLSTTGSSQSSTVTNSSQSLTPAAANSISAALSDWADPWLSSSLADPWLSSSTTTATNSGQTSGAANSFLFANEDDIDALYLEMDHVVTNMYNAAISVTSSAPDLSNIAAIEHPPNVPNAQILPQNASLYESDSDFYDSDKDDFDITA